MSEFDKRADKLIEMIWQSFIKDWVKSDCQEPEYVNDYLNEILWEFIDKIDLDLAFYILACNPTGLDWGFFKDMYSDCSHWVDGPYAVKNTALQVIWDDHLIPRAEAFKLKLFEKPKPSEKTKSDKQIWKGTLDPEKIKGIAQIPPEDRKDNRSGSYNRHPC